MASPIETIRLPAVALKDIKQKHPDTWNIVNVGFGKENENQIVEDEAVDACCAVKFPAGSINPGAKGRPTGGLGFYACPIPIFPATDVEMSYKLQFDASFDPACVRPRLCGCLWRGVRMKWKTVCKSSAEIVWPLLTCRTLCQRMLGNMARLTCTGWQATRPVSLGGRRQGYQRRQRWPHV